MARGRSVTSSFIAPALILTACAALAACSSSDGDTADGEVTPGEGENTSGASTTTSVSPTTTNPSNINPGSSPSVDTTASVGTTATHTTALAPSGTDPRTTDTSGTSNPGADSTDPAVTSGDPTSTSDGSNTTDPNGTSNGDDAPGFYVQDGKLYDVNGVEFIMRGVNYPYTWYKSENTQQKFADIASTGANVVRIVLSSGDHSQGWQRNGGAEVTNLINWAKENKLVAMLEVHDATGYGDPDSGEHPNVTLDYWTSDDILSAIKGQEAYVLINIANESFGNELSQEWEEFYEAGVGELRAAGLHHTLIVDAPFWGQDWGNCMRDGRTSNPREMSCDSTIIFAADPDANTVFSVHMYDVYGQPGVISEYFDKFLLRGLPLIVGEFAADHGEGNEVDEATIMRLAEERKLGYLGWSWSGNSSHLSSLDITENFNLANLTPWGNTLINGPNGLKETGVPCTCFE